MRLVALYNAGKMNTAKEDWIPSPDGKVDGCDAAGAEAGTGAEAGAGAEVGAGAGISEVFLVCLDLAVGKGTEVGSFFVFSRKNIFHFLIVSNPPAPLTVSGIP
jgi:hypothetical protein